MVRGHYWQCLGGSHGVLGIEPGFAMCKLSALPAVLSSVPMIIFYEIIEMIIH